MYLRSWRFLTIMLSVVAAGAALGHLLELPGKMQLNAYPYVMTHRILYPTFGRVAGTAEVLALLSVIGLAWRIRTRGAAFPWVVAAVVCQSIALVVYFLFVHPANMQMQYWQLDALPWGWFSWRDRWEYGHAVRALLLLGAVSTQVVAILQETSAAVAGAREHKTKQDLAKAA